MFGHTIANCKNAHKRRIRWMTSRGLRLLIVRHFSSFSFFASIHLNLISAVGCWWWVMSVSIYSLSFNKTSHFSCSELEKKLTTRKKTFVGCGWMTFSAGSFILFFSKKFCFVMRCKAHKLFAIICREFHYKNQQEILNLIVNL